MYKHILVAVDDSKTSALALKEAIGLAVDQKAKLTIVHVIDELIFAFTSRHVPAQIPDIIIKSAHKLLLKAEQAAQKKRLKPKILLLKTTINISDKIAETAKHSGVDLIVIGTHGRRGFNRFILGSVAEKLVRCATVPVLLIREK